MAIYQYGDWISHHDEESHEYWNGYMHVSKDCCPWFNLPLVLCWLQCVYFLNNNNCILFWFAGTLWLADAYFWQWWTPGTWIGILKREMHYTAVVCTHFFDLYFQMHVMSNAVPGLFLIFAYEMLCHWSTSDTNLVGTIWRWQEIWLLLRSSVN